MILVIILLVSNFIELLYELLLFKYVKIYLVAKLNIQRECILCLRDGSIVVFK